MEAKKMKKYIKPDLEFKPLSDLLSKNIKYNSN